MPGDAGACGENARQDTANCRSSFCLLGHVKKSRRFGDAQAEVDAALRLWNPSDIRRYVLHESVLRPLTVAQQE